MAVTIYDVAKKAGVGIGTVSRALNNSPQILPETKARILQVIKQLNYKPHALAQSLARKRTGTIAIVVPFFMTYFFVEMLKGIQHELTRHNYDLILYSVDKHDKIKLFLNRTIEEKRVDGVILSSLPISDKYANKFVTSGLPIVLLDTLHPILDSITIENEKGAYRATRRLIEGGHRKIGLINANLSSGPARLRFAGFKSALAEFDLPLNENYLFFGELTDESEGFNRKCGFEAMTKLLELGKERPTALFIASDIQAIGALKALQEHDLQVPDDLAIVSFDDIEIAEFFGLTTMRQPIYQMGQMAADRLIKRITGAAGGLLLHKFEPELIVRKSCCRICDVNP